MKRERQKRGETLRTFSKRAGLSHTYVSLIEKGYDKRREIEIVPSIDTMAKIAKALGTSLDKLLFEGGFTDEESSEYLYNKNVLKNLNELKESIEKNEQFNVDGSKVDISEEDKLKIMSKIDECINFSKMIKNRNKQS